MKNNNKMLFYENRASGKSRINKTGKKIKNSKNEYYEQLVNDLRKESEIKAVLINRDGQQKFRYINDNSPIPVNSITKTIVAILVGIAIKEGYIDSVEEPVECFGGKANIEDLLTMSSGMKWEESYLFEADNWIERICSCNISEEMKGVFQYNGGSSHLLGKIISDRSGMRLEDFADKFLFTPLGINFKEYENEIETVEYELTERKWISKDAWDKDPQGNNIGSFSLRLKADDLEKIGMMLASKGIWSDIKLLEEEYVEEMIFPSVRAKGLGYYGYQGWIKKIRGKTVYSGIGINNQYLSVIPEDRTVIVFLTESRLRLSESGTESKSIENLYINVLMNELAR